MSPFLNCNSGLVLYIRTTGPKKTRNRTHPIWLQYPSDSSGHSLFIAHKPHRKHIYTYTALITALLTWKTPGVCHFSRAPAENRHKLQRWAKKMPHTDSLATIAPLLLTSHLYVYKAAEKCRLIWFFFLSYISRLDWRIWINGWIVCIKKKSTRNCWHSLSGSQNTSHCEL